MKVVYALEDIDKVSPSIFLAGPTHRESGHRGWRKDAIEHLESFDGEVYYPEARTGIWHGDYPKQIEWEWEGLESASVILFWVPRDMDKLPALTTNVEFGLWLHSGKSILGYPSDATSMNYLDYIYRKVCEREPYGNLEATCQGANKHAEALGAFGGRFR